MIILSSLKSWPARKGGTLAGAHVSSQSLWLGGDSEKHVKLNQVSFNVLHFLLL